ncbi:HAD-IA family hydrolase [Aeromonas sp. BIGb0445]|jgi:FMN hydrolase / 5-amino-6-(5-phospho-D-ribitylamino)uracil phosphatase|uniref:HAD-IA family hydrolase n=1 Tax=Aeromonas sp. BIGb0445 TaxID=2940593 RepID=UPI0021684619|nr:HAD-IA family hydrolase [Aeromonas sp. BIGb0445]MCS3461565.1 putative hydrolase of the HAD superfamily [Aeromonas sp. BIGb0445]
MLFFRRWQPVKAISFDLDDTLYDNGPHIARADAWMLARLRSDYLAGAMMDADRWLACKRQVLQQDPERCHDVSLTRKLSLQLALCQGGMEAGAAEGVAAELFEGFMAERSAITVPAASHELLAALARRYPLVAITNGNLDLVRAGLDGYFQGVYKAGEGQRMKPAPDLFVQAATELGLAPAEILHVGDHERSDVLGARLHGYRAAWLNQGGGDWRRLSQLPDLMLNRLDELGPLLLGHE